MVIYCHFPTTNCKLCYTVLLNQSNFSAFKFSNVSYCFAIKAIKHKISKVFTVTCVFVQIEQSSCTIDLATVFDAILTSRQTREKLQCLYENLMSNNFRKTALLKKI